MNAFINILFGLCLANALVDVINYFVHLLRDAKQAKKPEELYDFLTEILTGPRGTEYIHIHLSDDELRKFVNLNIRLYSEVGETLGRRVATEKSIHLSEEETSRLFSSHMAVSDFLRGQWVAKKYSDLFEQFEQGEAI